MEFILLIALLIMSIVIHEVSHGFAAYGLGDPTAKFQGRLTLNPIKHIDPVGSVIVPFLMFILPTNFIFGWAKPVPYNPYNLSNQRWGEAWVAFAGPLSNIALAAAFGIFLRIGMQMDLLTQPIIEVSMFVIFVNILLAVFNLVPIPPLDGSKILFSILPYRFQQVRYAMEPFGLILVLFFVLFFFHLIYPIILYTVSFMSGFSLPEIAQIISALFRG